MKKLCGFSTVWADRADLGSTKTAEQKLKYATFEVIFFMFSWSKKLFEIYKKYCSVRTKKLHSIGEKKFKSFWKLFYFV